METENPEGSRTCCFWFSIKKKQSVAKNDKSRGVSSSGHDNWGKNDELLSDVSTFSVKEQERRLKKAVEDEKKANVEAERVVQWVKQESARIDASTIKSIIVGEHKEDTAVREHS